jgi:eukaryotic-like serine/threonine-protein kinase
MNSPVAIGSILADTYRIVAPLGAGGMGSVWTAEHLRLPGKRAAVKVLHTTIASGDVLVRFRREAEITSRIGHPNIVEVLDFNTLPTGEPFLVMELLTGESLSARLKRGPIPERSALDIARQIGSALFAAHGMNIVHRDLKPDNIFLCPRDVDGELRDHVKVLDFGISKIRNSQTVVTQDAMVLGTPYYMSPEQASGKNHEIDGRTDIFALGSIVFEMLTGQTAFPGDSVPAVIFQVVFQPHPPILQIVPTLTSKIAAAVDRALAKNPAERFQDMAAFVEALTGRPLAAVTGLRSVAASASLQLEATMAAPAGAQVAPAVAPTLAAPVAGTLATPAVKKKPVLLMGLAVVGVAAAVVLGLRATPTALPTHATSSTVVTSQPAVAPEPAIAAVAARPAAKNAREEAREKAPNDREAVAKPGDKVSRGRASAREEAIPLEVAVDLDAAEKALAVRDPAEAIRRARHSQYEKKTSKASSILTRAFCMQGDLGAAKAELSHVSGVERVRVLKTCRAAGLDL